ncbi:hypothetical protein [Brevifollis gellanilyticus]|nr:hypothetical protein [Brevifollis gellanilyticus]
MKHVLLLLLSLLLVTGCKSKAKPKPQPTGAATLIGIVEMVNPEQNYVLIRCEPMPSIAPGTELIALSSTGAKSKLVLTPEKKGYYVTADIKEGHPEVHHLVLVPRSQAATTDPLVVPPATPPPTPPPSASSSSSYQPFPTLPGFIPATAGSPSAAPTPTPASPPPAVPAQPQPQAPSGGGGGLGDLEPPVGGRP